MKLFRYYSFDECFDEQAVTEHLDQLYEEGKIDWEIIDRWTFRIDDNDLSEFDERMLIDFFEEMNIIPSSGFEDDDDFSQDIWFD